MGSTLFSITRNPTANLLLRRSYYTGRFSKTSLYSRISPLGDPNVSVVPVLDQWVEEGKKVRNLELQRIIRDLRGRRRYEHALEISEWVSNKEVCPFSSGDRALQLDLIGKVRGLSSAESYFNNMSDQDKTDKTYGALLNCYVRDGLVDKSLSHFQKMKEMGFASSTLTYNDLLSLYTRAGLLEKIPDVLSEMKDNGVSPNNFTYRICINSYGARSDFDHAEKLLEEMESQEHISMDWSTYAMVANFYIKSGLNDKALVALKKSEEKVYKDALGYNYLISLYASLGNKDEIMRLWGLEKTACKKQINRDYITMLGSLVKLGEFEEAEVLLKEWESSSKTYDFRVPNVILIGYSHEGLVEKAETMLREMVGKGKTPIPNSWGIVAAGYVAKQNMEKALACMKEALAVHEENKEWRPKPHVLSSILTWLGDSGEVEAVEGFVSSLKMVLPMDREMYYALIKASIRSGKEVSGLLESMKADKIDENEELQKILSLMQEKIE